MIKSVEEFDEDWRYNLDSFKGHEESLNLIALKNRLHKMGVKPTENLLKQITKKEKH